MKIPWSKALSFWWSMTWRAGLYSFIVGTVAGLVNELVIAVKGDPSIPSGTLLGGTMLVLYILLIFISMVATKQALEKHNVVFQSLPESIEQAE